jgi:hypothetical protein
MSIDEDYADEVWLNSILCSDFAIKRIDEPFVVDGDDKDEWAL